MTNNRTLQQRTGQLNVRLAANEAKALADKAAAAQLSKSELVRIYIRRGLGMETV